MADFAVLLGEVTRAWRQRLDERLKPLGLSQAKWLAIWHLARSGEGINQRDLAARIGISAPTLVRLLDRMARDGHIQRRDASGDRRSNCVHLTRAARRTFAQIDRAARDLRTELLAGIPAAQLRVCIGVFGTVKARIAAPRPAQGARKRSVKRR